jgi:hypothetical protein
MKRLGVPAVLALTIIGSLECKPDCSPPAHPRCFPDPIFDAGPVADGGIGGITCPEYADVNGKCPPGCEPAVSFC